MEAENQKQDNVTESAPAISQEVHYESTVNKNNNVLLAVLAYIGPLIIISYFIGKTDPFVKFHIKQGLVLIGIEVVLWIVEMFWSNSLILTLLNIGIFILSILGIINAVQHKEKELPILGQLANKISI